MNAPDNAYASTLTLKGADGSTLNIRLPKPLKEYVGSETDPTRQLEAFKRLFKVDHAEFVQTKLSDGTLAAGLLAYVREGSVNATFHNIAKTTSASQPSRRGRHTAGIGNGTTVVPYVGLNDGGLNVRPSVAVTLDSQWGNWIRVRATFAGSYYNEVDRGTLSFEELPVNDSTIGYVAPKATDAITGTFVHDSPEPPSPGVEPEPTTQYPADVTYHAKAEAINDTEGSAGFVTNTFVSDERVLHPRRGFMFSASEPSDILDMTGDVRYDMYETDYFKMFRAAIGTVTSLNIRLYSAPDGATPPDLQTKLPSGWYHDSLYDTASEIKAFFVNASGIVERVKKLSELAIEFGYVYLRFCNDKQAPSPSAYPRYALEYELIIGPAWDWVTYDMMRVTVKGDSSATANPSLRTGINLRSTESGSIGFFQSNLTTEYMTATMTVTRPGVGGSQNTDIIRGIYRSEADANNDPNADSPYWLNAASYRYADVKLEACTIEARRAVTGKWETAPRYIKLVPVVAEFTLERNI